MHQPERRALQGFEAAQIQQAFAHVGRDARHGGPGQRGLTPAPPRRQERLERDPVHVLERNVGEPFLPPRGPDADEIGMAELLEELRFPEEGLGLRFVQQGFGTHPLERDPAIVAGRVGLLREEDLRHGPHREPLHDHVPTE